MASTHQESGGSNDRSGEIGRLKVNSAATIDELRDFVGQMKGRSPQEVLGLVAESGLVQATLLATVGCAVLLVLLTVGPYLLQEEKTAAKPADTDTTAATETNTESESETTTAAKAGDADAPPAGREAAAAKVLGIDETKESDPAKNPLDKELDSLLEID